MNDRYEGWSGFEKGDWMKGINVRDFIRCNYVPYDGDERFLEGPTQNTLDLWEQVIKLTKQEREAGGCTGYGHPSGCHNHFSWTGLSG